MLFNVPSSFGCSFVSSPTSYSPVRDAAGRQVQRSAAGDERRTTLHGNMFYWLLRNHADLEQGQIFNRLSSCTLIIRPVSQAHMHFHVNMNTTATIRKAVAAVVLFFFCLPGTSNSVHLQPTPASLGKIKLEIKLLSLKPENTLSWRGSRSAIELRSESRSQHDRVVRKVRHDILTCRSLDLPNNF